MRPSGGQAVFAGKDVTGAAPETIVRLGLSHVPERRLVFKPLSVADNLLLGAYTRSGRARRAQREEDLADIFAMFPVLEERLRQPAGTLSGGEQQMLAIGRALMARPKMLLLDEPGMGLAPTICRDIFSRITELREKRGLTVLLVEQNAKSALAVADSALQKSAEFRIFWPASGRQACGPRTSSPTCWNSAGKVSPSTASPTSTPCWTRPWS